MDNKKLKRGTKVLVSIPFTYNIGEEGISTEKVLETIQDCKDEVVAELESGHLIYSKLYFVVKAEQEV